MIPNSNQFPGNCFSATQFSTFAWALGVGGHYATKFSNTLKDTKLNSTYSNYNTNAYGCNFQISAIFSKPISQEIRSSIKSWTYWVILRMKYPNIWAQPTQFRNLSEIFEIIFPRNWTKSWISPDISWISPDKSWISPEHNLLSQFQPFKIRKIAQGTKLWQFLIPEFILDMARV